MGAKEISQALADRAGSVCRAFLPNSRKAGNFWQVGNVQGDAGRSLTVRLQNASGKAAGRWQDHATGEFGDLLDLIEENTAALNTGEAMRTARQFLGQPDPEPVNTAPPITGPKTTVKSSSKSDAGARLFAIGQSIAATLVEAYLRGRSITRFGNTRGSICLALTVNN